MPALVHDDLVEAAASVLLGAIDVDDGPTAAQLAVLGTIVAHLWERPDLDLTTLKPMAPADAAREIADPAVRRRVTQLMVTLELCRHPQTPDQIRRVEEYARALEAGGPALAVIREWIDDGVEFATADYDRSYANVLPELSEPTLRDRYLTLTEPDAHLARQLKRLHALPEGTLGYWYLEFYRRNNFALPGDDVHFPAHYVSHDMNHVIAGYEPTGPGEIALGAFTLAMNDNDANWLQFMTNLFIHEAGMLKHGEIMPNPRALERPGATELLGEALQRGAHCTADFSQTDHLALAALPLDDVRSQFNVTPLATPMF